MSAASQPTPTPGWRRLARSAATIGWVTTGGWAGASVAYLLAILGSAARVSRPPEGPAPDAPAPMLLVLVPAHDEEPVIAETVDALLASDYPPASRRIIVIADNCTDATAEVARARGAEVWERHEPAQRGKGPALAWALTRGWALDGDVDAILIVDADCLVSANLLAAFATRLAAGAAALQADYVAANPRDSPMAGLRSAAFLLMNTVRPMGKDRLGLSAGLLGTGMAFSRDTLRQVPWSAFSITEDREYHLRLVQQGIRVSFVPEARVVTRVPVSLSQGETQQTRWDTGNAQLARRWFGALAIGAVRQHDRHQLGAAVELLVPPQASLVALTGVGFAFAVARRSRGLLAASAATVAGQAAYVLLGVSLVDSPAILVRALPSVPTLVLARVRQQLRILLGRGSATWDRTERNA